VSWLEDNFFVPLGKAVSDLVNGIIDMLNAITMAVRSTPGFENFGVLLNHVELPFRNLVDQFASSADDLKGAMDANTKATERTVEASEANLPSGYKVGRREFDSASYDRGGLHINGDVHINARGSAGQELEDLSRRNRRGYSASLGRNVVDGDSN
jgi:hypothetical protein